MKCNLVKPRLSGYLQSAALAKDEGSAAIAIQILMTEMHHSLEIFTYGPFMVKSMKMKRVELHYAQCNFKPFMPNGFSHRYQLIHSFSVLKVVGWYFTFLFKFQ